MHYYFLDTENIQPNVLVKYISSGIFKVKKKSTLIMFFNKYKHIVFEDMDILQNYFSEIIIEEVNLTGANALDFYIVASIGMIASKNQSSHIHIVSEDRGYLNAITAFKTYLKTNKFYMTNAHGDNLNGKTKPLIGMPIISEPLKIETVLNITENEVAETIKRVVSSGLNVGGKSEIINPLCIRYTKVIFEERNTNKAINKIRAINKELKLDENFFSAKFLKYHKRLYREHSETKKVS